MNINYQKFELIEFFKVYPNINQKIDIESTNKYINYFKKNQKILDKLKEEKEEKEKRLKYSYKKSKSLLNISSIKFKNKSAFKRKISLFNGAQQKKNLILSNSYYKEKDDSDIKITNKKEENKNNDINVKKEEEEVDYYLINKGIYLQKIKHKRTEDVRKSLEVFLFNSKFFENLSNNLFAINSKIKNSKKFLTKREGNIENEELQIKIQNKLNNIVLNLSEKVLIQKYDKNKYVIKMNEIGKDCYFLVSGKVSILKPVEYRNIKMTLKEYLIYIKCLLNLDEIDLVLKVLSVNSKFLDITNIDQINKLIRTYFIVSLKRELNKNLGGITMEEIEKFFEFYHFTFQEFQLDKKKIIQEIEEREEKNKNKNFGMLLWEYFTNKISLTNEDIFLLNLYKTSFKGKDKPTVTLYKYEIFLFLYPGSFFGDMALDNSIKKRNATVRTEEDCIICSLSNEYYSSLLYEENKKIKTLDLLFLCHNFFFNLIPPVIFNKYYYPMFKETEKIRKNVIYNQDEEITSIFLLREGIINMELNVNVFDIFDLIKNIIKEIYSRNKYFKVNVEDIKEMKNNYLIDKNINKIYNDDNLFKEANRKMNFDLFTISGNECLGIQEFCLNMKYMTKCTVISQKAHFMEIQKEDLSLMVENEREILPKYYKYVLSKLLLLIKRLYFIKKNLINQLIDKISIKSLNISDDDLSNISNVNIKFKINRQGNNSHKQKIQVLNSEKVKDACALKNKNNSISFTERKFFYVKKKNLSNKNSKSFEQIKTGNKLMLRKKRKNSNSNLKNIKNELLPINENECMNSTLSFSKNKINKYREGFLSQNNIDKYNDKNNDKNKINNDIVNTKHGFISIKKIKKNIIRSNKERKNSIKLNIVQKYICSNNEEISFDNVHLSLSNFKRKNNKEFKHTIKNLLKSKNNLRQTKLKINNDNKNNVLNLTKDDNESTIFDKGLDTEKVPKKNNKSCLNIKIKESLITNNKHEDKENEKSYNIDKRLNSSISSLPGIQKSYRKIKNLIGDMKRNYAISLGQKKFIIYRKSKKNKVTSLVDDKKTNSTFRQKSIGQTIKDYYFKKKIEGYSAMVNPLHNTYINRQKTVKIKKNVKI